MNRITMLIVLLFIMGTNPSFGQQQSKISLSIVPMFDIPITPDDNLFQPSGGLVLNKTWSFPKAPVLFRGLNMSYHIGRLEHNDFPDLGTISISSLEGIAGIKGTIGSKVDLSLTGGGGWYYAFENDEFSSHASNWVLSGGPGIGFHLKSGRTISFRAEYRYYNRLYRILGFGLGIEIAPRFGGNQE